MIIETIIKSIDISVKNHPDNTISFKVSSLCDIEKLRIYNKIQIILSEIDESFKNEASFVKAVEYSSLISRTVPPILPRPLKDSV